MSKQSNNQGRAFEYICLVTLHEEISKYRTAVIETDQGYLAAQHAWNSIDTDLQSTLRTSAKAAVTSIFELEPLIIEDGNDQLDLKIQTDQEGIAGDVRDILIIRRNIQWEIGLSVKHNHLAVKHSRLSKNLDFGASWYGISCSEDYWNAVSPIFGYLETEKNKRTKWSDIPDKMGKVYVPILQAFINELNKSCQKDANTPRKMVEYLLGKFDFYKVISLDSRRITQIQTFNLRGTLNKAAQKSKPQINVPVSTLPTRIVHMDFVPGSQNRVEVYMDGGWQFSFRLHNASTIVEPSLKFDIQIIGMPATIISINCTWI